MNKEQKKENLPKTKQDEKFKQQKVIFLIKEEKNETNNKISKNNDENVVVNEDEDNDLLKRVCANTNNALAEIETFTKLFEFFPEETFKVRLLADPHGIYRLTKEEEEKVAKKEETAEVINAEFIKDIYYDLFFLNIFFLPVARLISEVFVGKCLKKIFIWITKKIYSTWIYMHCYLKNNKNKKKIFLKNKNFTQY